MILGWPRGKRKGCGIPHPAWEGKRFFSISLLAWKKNDFLSMKNKQNHTFRVGREEIFLNFPSPMWEGKLFFPISLSAWGKGRDFFQFPFPHVGREEIVFLFPFLTVTLIDSFDKIHFYFKTFHSRFFLFIG